MITSTRRADDRRNRPEHQRNGHAQNPRGEPLEGDHGGMTLRWPRHAVPELPPDAVERVVERAAAVAEQLQRTFSAYADMADLEVCVGAGRSPGRAATDVHLHALLVRWSTGHPVVHEHTEPLLRRPDGDSPWQQVLTPEEAGHRMQAVLGSWAAET